MARIFSALTNRARIHLIQLVWVKLKGIGDSPNLSSDNGGEYIAVPSNDPEFSTVLAQINSVFDDKDDFLSAEFEVITDHRYIGGIPEFNLEYTNGDTSWHHVTVVKDEDPHTTTNYIIGNDLRPVSNRIHWHWAHKFLRSLKRTMCRLRRCDFNGFDVTTYHLSPGKKRRSRRYQSDSKTKSGPEKATAPTH